MLFLRFRMKRRKSNPALGWEEISIVVPGGKSRKMLLHSPLAAWVNIAALLIGMRMQARLRIRKCTLRIKNIRSRERTEMAPVINSIKRW